MIFQIAAILILLAFYTAYFAKIVIQKKQSIKTNQMGVGNKPRRVIIVERIMSAATILTCVVGVLSIFLVKSFIIVELRILGAVLGVLAVIIFTSATITMKSSWRVGIPEEKTTLVTNGIYSWSRNPAFVGFDLLYISISFMFFNIPLVLVSLWAAVMLHLQILQEEVHMENMFGEEYVQYKKHTGRYLGIKGLVRFFV